MVNAIRRVPTLHLLLCASLSLFVLLLGGDSACLSSLIPKCASSERTCLANTSVDTFSQLDAVNIVTQQGSSAGFGISGVILV